jgi:hypothetical protein
VNNDAVVELLAKIPAETKIQPFTCVTVENFTVDIGGTVVPARVIAGQSFTVGQKGFALWQPPLPPLCFSTEVDTGWNTVSYAGGFSAGTPGQLQYRKIGNEVYVRGGATMSGDFPNDGVFQTVNSSALPADACPANVHRIAARGTSARPAAVTITPSGDMQGASSDANNDGAVVHAVSWIDFSTSYLTD